MLFSRGVGLYVRWYSGDCIIELSLIACPVMRSDFARVTSPDHFLLFRFPPDGERLLHIACNYEGNFWREFTEILRQRRLPPVSSQRAFSSRAILSRIGLSCVLGCSSRSSSILQAVAAESASSVPQALPQKGGAGAAVVMVPQKTTNKLRKRRVLRHVVLRAQRPSELCNNVIQGSARSPLQIFALLVGYRKLRRVSRAVNGERFAGEERTTRRLLLGSDWIETVDKAPTCNRVLANLSVAAGVSLNRRSTSRPISVSDNLTGSIWPSRNLQARNYRASFVSQQMGPKSNRMVKSRRPSGDASVRVSLDVGERARSLFAVGLASPVSPWQLLDPCALAPLRPCACV